jgi:hypothetical protein
MGRTHRAAPGEPLNVLRLVLVLTVILSAGALAACGGAADEPAPLAADLTLEQARAFEEFPLVYAGERFDGLPLVAIVRRDDTADYVSFVYGDCRPSSPEGGCAPPAEVQVWPAGRRSLGAYRASRGGYVPEPAPELTRIRGSPAAFFDAGTRLELYTAQLTVVLFARSRERLGVLAEALRCVAEDGANEPAESLTC